MVPSRQKPGRRALLDANFARRKLILRTSEYCIWDTELAGFGLSVRPSGNYYWFVRLGHRGKHQRITSGRAEKFGAGVARAQARRLFAEVALDGSPKRAAVKATPILSEFVETYWEDLARHWKARDDFAFLSARGNHINTCADLPANLCGHISRFTQCQSGQRTNLDVASSAARLHANHPAAARRIASIE
jgi:hypothetical protein